MPFCIASTTSHVLWHRPQHDMPRAHTAVFKDNAVMPSHPQDLQQMSDSMVHPRLLALKDPGIALLPQAQAL